MIEVLNLHKSWRLEFNEKPMMQCHHWPSKVLNSNTSRFAAVHVQIEVRNWYHHFNRSNANARTTVVSPFPSFFWLFREEFVKLSPRLWLEFTPFSGAQIDNTTMMATDSRLINECIRWLELPLEHITRRHNGADEQSESIAGAFNWQAPFLTGAERILHIGSEHASLNMKKMMRFVAELANVCSLFLTNNHHQHRDMLIMEWLVIHFSPLSCILSTSALKFEISIDAYDLILTSISVNGNFKL